MVNIYEWCLTDPSVGPSVDHALSVSPTQAQAHAEPRKALIGAKKTGAAKKSVWIIHWLTSKINI